MRRPFIAGNWKMNLNRSECRALASALSTQLPVNSACDVAICPPFVYLQTVADALSGSAVKLGAQDMHPQASGAFTGEISAGMLLDFGCQYVILGHSERRHIMGETDADVSAKVITALKAGLLPIVCLGETLIEREDGQTEQVVASQFEGSLGELSAAQFQQITIAYEPVWAIGTGKVATPEQAEQVHADLRTLIKTRYNSEVAETVRIQYGGSVKPENAGTLMAQPNIDGALVGGASLHIEQFLGIVRGVVKH